MLVCVITNTSWTVRLQVRVAQPSGYLAKPLVYLASNSSITC
jgi:hypothetical protein